MPADVVIYTTPYCFYCVRAKQLLAKKGVAFREIDTTLVRHDDAGNLEEDARETLASRTGTRKVPQIFINGVLLGGYYELSVTERSGELDQLLSGAPGVEDPDPAR
jgi:glutaredoxin 3